MVTDIGTYGPCAVRGQTPRVARRVGLSVSAGMLAAMTTPPRCVTCRVQPGVPVQVTGLDLVASDLVLCSWCAVQSAMLGLTVVVGAAGAPRPPGVGDLPAVLPAEGLELYPGAP